MQTPALSHSTLTPKRPTMKSGDANPLNFVDNLRAEYPLREMTVGVLGMAFKRDGDEAHALTQKLRKLLNLHARKVVCTDPVLDDPRLVPLERCLEEADVLVVAVGHDEYRHLDTSKPVIDCFGLFTASDDERGSR